MQVDRREMLTLAAAPVATDKVLAPAVWRASRGGGA